MYREIDRLPAELHCRLLCTGESLTVHSSPISNRDLDTTLLMMASALQCLRGRLAGTVLSALPVAWQRLPIASTSNGGSSTWSPVLASRGFAAPATGGPPPPPPPPPQQDGQQQQQQQDVQQQDVQQQQQQQQQKHGSASEDPGGPAASAGSGPPAGEAPQLASSSAGSAGGGGHHPDLHKYIASLKDLKGGWGN